MKKKKIDRRMTKRFPNRMFDQPEDMKTSVAHELPWLQVRVDLRGVGSQIPITSCEKAWDSLVHASVYG